MPFRLLPAVVTTFGSWHPATAGFLKECAKKVGQAAGAAPNAGALPQAVLHRWLCRLSVMLHRENATMYSRCAPFGGQDALDRPWSEGAPPLWHLPSSPCCCGDPEDHMDD